MSAHPNDCCCNVCLEAATGIHRARLSPIERGMTPSLAEHQAIEAALVSWEKP